MNASAGRIEVRVTPRFQLWIEQLRDRGARARIQARLDRASLGNLGDVRSLGGGLHEMRIDYGPGYRVYFLRKGSAMIVLLRGGDKRDQKADIELARRLAQEVPP